jgi:putative FmdB family regulatory protein
MPAYTFYCEKCKYKFEIICSIKDYSEKQRCEKCSNSRNVIRAYTEDLLTINSSVKKSDSELKTIGDLANRNRDKLTDDQKLSLHQKHNDYKEGPAPSELPKGMTRMKKTPKTKWV